MIDNNQQWDFKNGPGLTAEEKLRAYNSIHDGSGRLISMNETFAKRVEALCSAALAKRQAYRAAMKDGEIKAQLVDALWRCLTVTEMAETALNLLQPIMAAREEQARKEGELEAQIRAAECLGKSTEDFSKMLKRAIDSVQQARKEERKAIEDVIRAAGYVGIFAQREWKEYIRLASLRSGEQAKE